LEQYLPLITGSAGALVVLALVAWAFYSGKLHSDREFSKLEHENDQLREAYDHLRLAIETERRTVNETASAATVTNQLIGALASIASGRKATTPPPGLTAEDIGL
jgi:hypothetical protein